MTFGAKGTGFDTYNLPSFFLLRFIKRRYDKEEFDTDCSLGFLKSLNEILCSIILEKRKVSEFVRNSLSKIILQEKNPILTYNS